MISVFVNADHSGNVMTMRSHRGILIFVNNALIVAFSKRQNTAINLKKFDVLFRMELKMFSFHLLSPAICSFNINSAVKIMGILE